MGIGLLRCSTTPSLKNRGSLTSANSILAVSKKLIVRKKEKKRADLIAEME
jgi:hypothetical protein